MDNRLVAPQKKQLPTVKKRRKEIRISLVIKVLVLIVLLIVAISSMTNFIVFNLSYKALKNEIKDKLIMTAANAALAVDAEKLKIIQSPEDEGNEIYLELQQKLREIQKVSEGKLRYVYTVARSGSSYIYVLDASPIEDKVNHSSVGDEFPMKEYPDAKNGFKFPTADQEPLPDEEFHTISQSGYAPIKDSEGNVIGMIGIDMDVSTLKKEEGAMIVAAFIAFISCLALALILGILFARYLTKPILILTKCTKRVAEGDFNTVVNIERNDEFGLLARSFNVMTQDLKVSHESLKRYNLELEEKVRQRTAELTQINKEIKDILDNMSQAIFTIDENLVFHAQHSRFAFEIFGDRDFSGKKLTDIFFRNGECQDKKENLYTWLNKVFYDTSISWENLEPLQPVSEIPILVCNNGQEHIKFIRFNFKPIKDILPPEYREKTTKVMVIVQDITEKKTLELEMERKEKEYKDNITQIVEIIKMDQELFKDFIVECKENLVSLEPKLIRLKDEKDNMELINELFRTLHTIKGNAKYFKLERIAGEAHYIENIFSGVRKGEIVMNDELLNETFKKLDGFNVLFNETIEIYEKIVSGRNMDIGKPHFVERRQDEVDVIKVKVEELNRLSELIKKADSLISDDLSKVISSVEGMEKVHIVEDLFKETEVRLQALRKITIGKLFTRFPRMVRDIAIELGKKVELVIKGEDIRVDKNIFDKVADPLTHILRNSLDHGIEKPEERVSSGKAEEGIIELNIGLTSSNLLIEVKDDGKGLDIDKIKAKAVVKGLVTPEKALKMSDEEATNLIFLPGFSTSEQVSDISGRGVGMDVVRTCIEGDLRGSVTLQSKKNQGLKVILNVPLAS